MIVDFSDKEIQIHISEVRRRLSFREHFAYVYTFGCQQNEADSEKIRGILRSMSYTVTDSPESADIVILNTCAVRELAELKALSMIGNFKEKKRNNPNFIIGIAGCMTAEAHIVEKIKKSFHYVSFTLNPGMLHKLPELVLSALTGGSRKFVLETDNTNVLESTPSVRQSRSKAWVSVMHGCNNFCSYCIVPYVRGRERSRESSDVIAECRELINLGYKEITLLGQNVNSYKSDMNFASLLRKIAEIPGDFILRFMTSHPKDASDELISLMGEFPSKIAPHFHLPLQSGSDRILKAMNRTYDMKRYLSIVEKLRRAVPDIAITSDIIVGFPGESDEDFEATMTALENIRFDMVYSFNYSVRKGTRAALMDNPVAEEKKCERMTRLLKRQTEISHEVNEKYLGKWQRVILDSVTEKDGKRIYNARNAANKLVHIEYEGELPIGEFINVKIDRIGAFDLFGSEIREEN
ncbi:MAG: tRNA (N6-isopentenyl adenosine(37)-C2)-methylthiotransferase MiaB [Clostridia bacterium]|nr:tRNA (N6-isopentenyl adenosine(37)-C2)-methylthiotransferase MiaB [Clostridia bacterium]